MVILPIIAFLVTPIIAAPSPALCAVPGDESALVECPNPRPVIPDSTTGYSCNPPIVDAANAPLPYTFKNPTADQLAVNRRIEKAMGRGECTLTDNELQNIYNTFGDGLASVYPPPDYVREEAEALKSQKVCYVTCIDATDPTTIAWCNANACPIVGIDHTLVYLSPDALIRYRGDDVNYATYPCQNQYVTALSVDMCPLLEPQDRKC